MEPRQNASSENIGASEQNRASEKNAAFKSSCGRVLDGSKWITLNVGGEIFTTTRLTLTNREPDSMLARMFSQDQALASDRDAQGAYLIDRNGRYFRPILDYLRHGNIVYDENVSINGILEEAKFYGLLGMVELIAAKQQKNSVMSRQDFLRALVVSSHEDELRFQGVNLAGMNLSKLDLRSINFKYACLKNCNLSNADLSYCCLERADLRNVNLDGARLHNVQARGADLQNASMKQCDFVDPNGRHSNFEGTNLKGANLEGSMMEGVVLRVSNMKNANLRSCIMSQADISGADLEGCDLTGSNLHNTNLRGANLKDAKLELVITPLHMAQTI
uniref:BTB domain-containing protein n=1 Tax=Anopheles atroparvus TaxID=41427 RepID=A0A182IT59_ANOAO